MAGRASAGGHGVASFVREIAEPKRHGRSATGIGGYSRYTAGPVPATSITADLAVMIDVTELVTATDRSRLTFGSAEEPLLAIRFPRGVAEFADVVIPGCNGHAARSPADYRAEAAFTTGLTARIAHSPVGSPRTILDGCWRGAGRSLRASVTLIATVVRHHAVKAVRADVAGRAFKAAGGDARTVTTS